MTCRVGPMRGGGGRSRGIPRHQAHSLCDPGPTSHRRSTRRVAADREVSGVFFLKVPEKNTRGEPGKQVLGVFFLKVPVFVF